MVVSSTGSSSVHCLTGGHGNFSQFVFPFCAIKLNSEYYTASIIPCKCTFDILKFQILGNKDSIHLHFCRWFHSVCMFLQNNELYRHAISNHFVKMYVPCSSSKFLLFSKKKNRHLKGCLYMEHTCNLHHGGLHVLSAHLGQHFPSSNIILSGLQFSWGQDWNILLQTTSPIYRSI